MTTPRKVASRLVPGYVRSDEITDPTKGLSASVLRYRIMAYIVGTGLLILVFVGVPLQYGASIPQVDEFVGPIHGFLYIVYLLSAVDLARRARFTLPQMAAMIGAGFLPFLAFIIEHRVMKRMGLPAAAGSGGPGSATAASGGADTDP
jgi:integral membrane protein